MQPVGKAPPDGPGRSLKPLAPWGKAGYGDRDSISVQKVIVITAVVLETREIRVVTNVTLGPAAAECIGTVTGTGVNVRAGPGTHYAIIAQLDMGTQVTVLGVEDGWARVRLADGREGYISTQFVEAPCIPRG